MKNRALYTEIQRWENEEEKAFWLSIYCYRPNSSGLDLVLAEFQPQTTRFTLSYDGLPKGFDGYRIALISDMHGIEFGHKNGTLVKRIQDFDPDIVVCTGDMISSNAKDGQAS